MYRRPNHTDYFSPSSLFSSSNPNSSTAVQQSNSAVAASASSPMSDDDLVASPSSNNNSPSPSPSPPPSSVKNELATLPPPPMIPPASTRPAAFPAREDCWSEAATHTLIEAWGSHYVELKRGNLRQKHWQEVANAVNALHGHSKKQFRTDIQCKNRIDTLKKKYKIEKARVSQSHSRYVPQWPFFNSLDVLIGDNFKPSPLPVTVAPRRKTPPLLPPPPSAVPVGPRSKRPAAVMEDAVSRRNFSAMAAAAAAAASEDSDEEEESETSSPVTFTAGALSRRKESGALAEGCSRLAEAIGKFAEIYERVEDAKQRQMVELEKQRMQFAKDLEIQRMKLIMESQVQLEKLKRAKNSSQAGNQQTSGRRTRTARMQVNTNYIRYNIQVPQSILDDTYTDEIEDEEEEEVVEEEDINEFVDQDMSEYFERSTCYVPSVMDIDANKDGDDDEEQEACAICLLEYKDEDNIGTLQCGHEFHAECINKWLQRKKIMSFL